MMSYLWIFLLASLAIGPNAQDLDLSDAVAEGDAAPAATPAAVPENPAVPAPEETKEPTGAAEPTPEPAKPTEAPKAPEEPAGGDLDLGDAVDPEPEPKPVPDKPAVDTPTDEGNAGGSFGDSDLLDHGNNDNDHKPDGGKARAADPAPGANGEAADEPQEAGAGQIAGIVSAVGAAIVGAVGSYFAYQKKKLCFKVQGGDPESANKESGTQADPQVMSNLLKSS
ncbi:CD99 molecule isoform X3 [Anguilla anguilla]|uniref:CD99 molecule isoform X3 n=1 Tax=Anguilla anguilla TaxID=7936 RepID=UPI0015B175CE|nr:CD99 molecule isoform X3 [Anguilla anguilla]